MKWLSLALVVVCLVAFAAGEGAHLLTRKDLLSDMLVHNKEMTIQFTVFNIGTKYVYSHIPTTHPPYPHGK